ncbi:MAG: aminotransferase class I/II-fold pyridoxal phosphate-dependent enzyme, partial [Gammaproteobacteria bacterium]
LAGKPAIIEQINKIRLPYNINILTQASAEFALGNTLLFDEQIRKICTERMVMFNRLSRLNNIRVFPSVANFILFKTGENQADGVFGDLQQQGILIKNLSPQGGLLRDCLRVTIGKPEENAAFLTALEKSLASR